MPPITEKMSGGGAYCRHHHRERLRNHRVPRARQDDHVRRGVHFHQLPCVRRRQRQQLAPRASRWRRGGAKQTALALREGQALEERSSSSRSLSRPRTRGRQLPCVRRRQRQQLAPRASRWRRGGAKQTALAPREGQALEERSSSSRSSTSWPRTRGRQLPCVRRRQRQRLAPRAGKRHRGGAEQIALAPREGQALKEDPVMLAGTSRIGTAAYAWRPAAVRHHDNGGSSSATGAESKRALRAGARISQGLRPCRPKVQGRPRSQLCGYETNAVRHHDDSGVRRRHTTTTAARARGARRS